MIGMTFIMIILYVVFKELEQHGHDSKFPKEWGKWWNNNTAWKNKHNWKPNWLFRTAFVWTTDAEHLFQMLSNWCVAGAVAITAGSLPLLFAAVGVIWVISFFMNEDILK